MTVYNERSVPFTLRLGAFLIILILVGLIVGGIFIK